MDEPKGKELIKEHGMSVVFNGRMNERVKAGTAAVREYPILTSKSKCNDILYDRH